MDSERERANQKTPRPRLRKADRRLLEESSIKKKPYRCRRPLSMAHAAFQIETIVAASLTLVNEFKGVEIMALPPSATRSGQRRERRELRW